MADLAIAEAGRRHLGDLELLRAEYVTDSPNQPSDDCVVRPGLTGDLIDPVEGLAAAGAVVEINLVPVIPSRGA